MSRALRDSVRLQMSSRSAAARVLALAVVVEAALRVTEFPKLVRRLGISLVSRPAGQPLPSAPSLKELVATVDRILRRWPEDGRCLRRALVLGLLLRRHSPVIRIGVVRERGVVRAHAWLEVDNRPIGEPSDPTLQFSPLSAP